MRVAVSLLLSLITVASIHEIGSTPLSPDSAIWHKIAKRDAHAPPADENNKNNSSQGSTKEKEGKASKTESTEEMSAGSEHGLIETQPDSPPQEPPTVADEKLTMSAADDEQWMHSSEKPTDNEDDANSERSINWQLLSGSPTDLERELEYRRRRRSVRRSSLSRQHRIRTTGLGQRSRSKRDAYYSVVNPSDLLAAYAYLQARREEQEEQEPQPQLSLLGEDATDGDLSNLASLIYELQRADGGETPAADDSDEEEEDQQFLPGGYVDLEPTNEYQPEEIRITPEQLAALEQALSEQQEDEDGVELYPKDKRSLVGPMFTDDDTGADEDDEEVEDAVEPTYLIPASLEPSTEYVRVRIPVAAAYESPYDRYQIDDDPSVYGEAARRIDEEQLRQRIASLIDDINEQRQIAHRRRRR